MNDRPSEPPHPHPPTSPEPREHPSGRGGSRRATASSRRRLSAPAGHPARRSLCRRLKRLRTLLSRLFEEDDPETVHDVRVWSRRLQQGLDAMVPKPRPRKVRSVRRRLRALRRALGEWRNLDVVIGLVEARRRRLRQPSRQAAWARVEAEMRTRREREIARARKRLQRKGVARLGDAVESLILNLPASRPQPGGRGVVRPAIARAWSEWNAAHDQACRSRSTDPLHAFRIQTKRLRYRLELARDVGENPPAEVLRWLKRLQDSLGSWHDRQVLRELIARILARPEILLEESVLARTILRDLERDRRREAISVDSVVRLSDPSDAGPRLERWMQT